MREGSDRRAAETLKAHSREGRAGESEAEDAVPPLETSFINHLREMRSRLIKSLLALLPGFGLAYSQARPILEFLARPLKEALPEGPGLIATALPDTFLVHLKIAFWGSFFLASPFWLYQLWAFMAPGLYGQEKKNLRRLSFFGAILLFSGAAFAYYVVIPIAFQFFVATGQGEVTFLPAIGQYLSLVTGMLAVFGLTFQLPLALLFLASLGLVDAAHLKAFRRYAVLLIFIVAALLTPPDVISQVLLAIPMLALYELSIFLISRAPGQSKTEER